MSSQDESGFNLKPSIPQLFYDIIARIVPGTVFIGVLSLAAAGPERSAQFVSHWLNKRGEDYPSIIVMVVFGFVLSYTLSVVFLGFYHVISKLLPKRWKPASSDVEFPMKYDFIKNKDRDAGSRITKLTAERHMAGILTLGLALSLVVNVFKMWDADGSRGMLALVLLAAIVGSVGAFFYFINRQDHAIQNYCKIHDYAGWKREHTAREVESSNADAPAAVANAENGKREASPAVRSTA
jgi:hypothetical protein